MDVKYIVIDDTVLYGLRIRRYESERAMIASIQQDENVSELEIYEVKTKLKISISASFQIEKG